MFSSALKSFNSNISSNYVLAPQPTTVAGPWKVFDAKKKSSGKAVSVFVFDRKSLQAPAGSGFASSRSAGAGLGRAHDEVVERLKKEASSLARLRHPSILELAEPVEETRNGGLMFATEPVTASLAGLLEQKDQEESSSGVGGRRSRYVVEDPESGGRKRREVEIDELEIQKGLLQIGKGLEFLHESAGLVHCNLTPEAIFINSKSDWKLSGLGFCSPPPESNSTSSVAPIALSEVLNYDSRLPRSVQLNFDYLSPDLIVDNNINPGADIFSLGLVIIALYNSPHQSPLNSGYSVSQYKRIFSSSSTIPTQANNFLSKNPIPKDVANSLLPRMITRRPAQRFNARDLQQAAYFDNILVSTIRFLDSLPAKTANEKSQFMRGLPRILNQFPKSVLEKKILPALLEEMKDPDLLTLTLANVFKVISMAANSRRAFSEQVVPRLRQVFLSTSGGKNAQPDRDTAKETGLVVLFDNMQSVANNCSGKEFKADILPIILFGLESPTHSVSDKALSTLSIVLPVLDFSTIKNELFPVVAQVFSKTSSLAIKVRGLEALKVLCGGLHSSKSDIGGLAEAQSSKTNSSAVLDKYTIQEKVMPLVKAIKTKEPTVMMAALDVLKQVGKIADVEFLATDVLPCLWQFSLGPLLNLQQFQAFMELNKSLASKIEQEHSRKLRDLSSGGARSSIHNSRASEANGGDQEQDFESLVTGRKSGADAEADAWGSWDIDDGPSQKQQAAFSWSSQSNAKPAANRGNMLKPQQGGGSRAITPDNVLESYTTLAPSKPAMTPSFGQTTKGHQPIQNAHPGQMNRAGSSSNSASFDWSSVNSGGNPWSGNSGVLQPTQSSQTSLGGINVSNSGFGASAGGLNNSSKFTIAPPPSSNSQNPWTNGNNNTNQAAKATGGALDKYESLL